MLLHTPYPYETLFVFGVLGLVLVLSLVGVFAWERRRKLQIIEDALRSDSVDPETKRAMVDRLASRERRDPWTQFGLVGVVAGVAMLTISNPFGIPSDTWRWLALNAIVVGAGVLFIPRFTRECRQRHLRAHDEVS